MMRRLNDEMMRLICRCGPKHGTVNEMHLPQLNTPPAFPSTRHPGRLQAGEGTPSNRAFLPVQTQHSNSFLSTNQRASGRGQNSTSNALSARILFKSKYTNIYKLEIINK